MDSFWSPGAVTAAAPVTTGDSEQIQLIGALEDPESEQVLARFEQASAQSERRTFVVPGDLDFYDARNRELIAGFNRWMLELFRAVTPAGGFLHVLDSELNHIGYRFFPHAPFEEGATPEQWWGFVLFCLPGALVSPPAERAGAAPSVHLEEGPLSMPCSPAWQPGRALYQ